MPMNFDNHYSIPARSNYRAQSPPNPGTMPSSQGSSRSPQPDPPSSTSKAFQTQGKGVEQQSSNRFMEKLFRDCAYTYVCRIRAAMNLKGNLNIQLPGGILFIFGPDLRDWKIGVDHLRGLAGVIEAEIADQEEALRHSSAPADIQSPSKGKQVMDGEENKYEAGDLAAQERVMERYGLLQEIKETKKYVEQKMYLSEGGVGSMLYRTLIDLEGSTDLHRKNHGSISSATDVRWQIVKIKALITDAHILHARRTSTIPPFIPPSDPPSFGYWSRGGIPLHASPYYPTYPGKPTNYTPFFASGEGSSRNLPVYNPKHMSEYTRRRFAEADKHAMDTNESEQAKAWSKEEYDCRDAVADRGWKGKQREERDGKVDSNSSSRTKYSRRKQPSSYASSLPHSDSLPPRPSWPPRDYVRSDTSQASSCEDEEWPSESKRQKDKEEEDIEEDQDNDDEGDYDKVQDDQDHEDNHLNTEDDLDGESRNTDYLSETEDGNGDGDDTPSYDSDRVVEPNLDCKDLDSWSENGDDDGDRDSEDDRDTHSGDDESATAGEDDDDEEEEEDEEEQKETEKVVRAGRSDSQSSWTRNDEDYEALSASEQEEWRLSDEMYRRMGEDPRKSKIILGTSRDVYGCRW